MWRKGLAAAALAGALVVSSAASAAQIIADSGFSTEAVLVNFQNPSLTPGTQVTNQYAAQGVTFAATLSGRWAAPGGASINNFNAGVSPTSSMRWSILFADDVSRAGAFFGFGQGTTARFEAFNDGSLVDSFNYATADLTPRFVGFGDIAFDELRVSNISRRTMSISGVRFDFVPAAVAPAPEPATWAMLLFGFGAVGTLLRRRRECAA